MPLTIIGARDANILDIDPELAAGLTGTIVFDGIGNRLRIAAPFAAMSLTLHLGGGAEVRLGARCTAGHLDVHVPCGGLVSIGEACAFNGHVRLLVHEPARLTLGDACLVAGDVVVTTSDMHCLVDRQTRRRLNPAADVTIGAHVWIGFRAFVGKGATIGCGSVIGAGAVVTGAIPAHAMAAGVPAVVRRHEIDWEFDLV